MSIGRLIKRSWVFASRVFKPWALSGADSASALVNRVDVEGTSAERFSLCGTSAQRIVIEGTSANRLTLESAL